MRTCPGTPRDSRPRTSVARTIDRYCGPGEPGGTAPRSLLTRIGESPPVSPIGAIRFERGDVVTSMPVDHQQSFVEPPFGGPS